MTVFGTFAAATRARAKALGFGDAGALANAETERAIALSCFGRLAYWKAPGYIAFVADLPLTSTQKAQRGELKALVAKMSADAYDMRALKRRIGRSDAVGVEVLALVRQMPALASRPDRVLRPSRTAT